MAQLAGSVLVLAVVWFLWSGHTEPLLLGLGLASSVFVAWFCSRMDFLERTAGGWGIALRSLAYGPWLFWEILKSTWDVAWRILHPKLPVNAAVVRIRPSQKTDLGRVTFANSITITPGTISIDMSRDQITVHALVAEAAEGLEDGTMDRKVRWFEGTL